MPIRSPRRLYQIPSITVNLDDDPNATDTPGGTVRPIVVKMKESVGDYFGLTPLNWDDVILSGVFGGSGLNQGANYRKTLGGFKDASYTLISETFFSITEKYYEGTVIQTPTTLFKTITIGFPKGHSVYEVINWLGGLQNFSNVMAIRTPNGQRHDLFNPA